MVKNAPTCRPGFAGLCVAGGDFDRAALAAFDLVQRGLAGDAESFRGFGEWQVAVGHVGDEAPADLFGEPDAPGGGRGDLLAGEQPFSQPAADRIFGDVQLDRGPLDGDDVAVGVGWWGGGDAGTEARGRTRERLSGSRFPCAGPGG